MSLHFRPLEKKSDGSAADVSRCRPHSVIKVYCNSSCCSSGGRIDDESHLASHTPACKASSGQRSKRIKAKNRKVSTVRHHDGSLCTQKQPETAAVTAAIRVYSDGHMHIAAAIYESSNREVTATKQSLSCRLSGPLHLRLLTVLCNDTLEGANMRAELVGRVDQISALHSERHQVQLEVHPFLTRPRCLSHIHVGSFSALLSKRHKVQLEVHPFLTLPCCLSRIHMGSFSADWS